MHQMLPMPQESLSKPQALVDGQSEEEQDESPYAALEHRLNYWGFSPYCVCINRVLLLCGQVCCNHDHPPISTAG